MKHTKAYYFVRSCACLILFTLSPLTAQVKHERLQLPPNITATQRETAIPDLGNSNLEKLLARYYELGLGGRDVWSKIYSMRLKGTLAFSGNEFKMRCYQRKPNRLKMILDGPQGQIVLGYDGKEAWQYMPETDSPAALMSADEARRFIHSSVFGNYLLYPYRSGKTIEYLGTTREMDTVCHRIRVVMQNSFTVDYYIDVRNYLDVKIVNRDLKFDTSTTLVCSDFKTINGFPVAFKVLSTTEDGVETTLILDQVDFNIGLTDWIFNRPE